MTNPSSAGDPAGSTTPSPGTAPSSRAGAALATEDRPEPRAAEVPPPPRRVLGVPVPGDWKVALGAYAWVQLVLLAWWAGQFPGYLSYDSTVYVTHVTTGPWTADHSVLYDFLVKISIHLTGGVWLLTLGQTVVWSLAIVYFVRSVQMWGVRWYWAVAPAVVLPFVPSIGALASTVWKDSAFAWCELLLGATLLRLVRVWAVPERTKRRRSSGRRARAADAAADRAGERGDEREAGRVEERAAEARAAEERAAEARAAEPEAGADPRPAARAPWRLLATVGAELLALMLFRNDGFLMVAVIAVVAIIALRGLRLRLLAISAAALAGWLLATAVVYPAAGIKPAQSSLSYGTFYADIAVVYRWAPGTFTAHDRAVMRKVAPLSSWRSGGRDCFEGDYLRTSPHYSKSAADKYRTELAKIWIRTMARTPVATVKSRLCRAAIAWDPVAEPWPRAGALVLAKRINGDTLFGRAHVLTPKMRKALKPRPLSHALGTAAYHVRSFFDGRVWQDFVWRGALWCYVAYLVLAAAAVRLRNWRLAVIGGLVCLSNQLMVMAANPAQLYRYIVGPIAIGILIVPIVLARRQQPAPAEATAERPAEVPAP